MDALTIALRKPTSEGRLYNKTSPQVQNALIFLQSENRRSIVYKILINEVIIEMDGNKLLYDVEVQFPRRVWKIENSVSIPTNVEEADITFPNLNEKSKYYDLPVQVITDPSYSVAKVIFGHCEVPLRSISLSHHCFALVCGQRLAGFFINRICS